MIAVVDRILSATLSSPGRCKMALAGVAFVAMTLLPHVGHAQVLDGILNTFQSSTSGWMTGALNLANELFAVLAAAVIVYNIVAFYIENQSVRGLVLVILRTSLSLGVPWVILTYAVPLAFGNVISNATQIATGVTGQSYGGVTPDSVWQTGAGIGWGLLQNSFAIFQNSHFQLDPTHLGDSLGYDAFQLIVDVLFLAFAVFLCIAMIASFTFIAVELLLATMQAIFCIPLGAWALGFSAATPTAGIAAGVWSGLLQVIVRYIAIFAGATFAETIGQSWQTGLNGTISQWNNLTANGSVDVGAFKTILSYALAAVALLYIVRQLPALAMAVMSGAPTFSGAQVLNSAAGAAASGAMMAAGVPGAGMQAFRVAAGAGSGWRSPQSGQSRVESAQSGAIKGAQRSRDLRNLFKK